MIKKKSRLPPFTSSAHGGGSSYMRTLTIHLLFIYLSFGYIEASRTHTLPLSPVSQPAKLQLGTLTVHL